MIVIADTGPINYLIQIEQIDVSPKLYGRILAPPSVSAELQDSNAPERVRLWIGGPPVWLEVRAPARPPDAALMQVRLGAGERDAIVLAQELGADEVIIVDESRGRREASKRQLHVIGTLGVLRAAADQGLLDFRQATAQLRATNFRFTREVLDRLIRGEEI